VFALMSKHSTQHHAQASMFNGLADTWDTRPSPGSSAQNNRDRRELRSNPGCITRLQASQPFVQLLLITRPSNHEPWGSDAKENTVQSVINPDLGRLIQSV